MSQIDQTAEQVFDSVTGFDEIAIAQKFGLTVMELAEKDGSMFVRSMIFIAKRRDGATDDEAWQAAMGMSTKDYTTFFAEPTEEEAGKDEATGVSPEPSLSSVS